MAVTTARSARGLDITFNEVDIEIRNTTLSNAADYELTDKLVQYLLLYTAGELFDESGDPVVEFPIFTKEDTIEREIQDAELITLMAAEHGQITIFGPHHKVYFGKRVAAKLAHLDGHGLRNRVYKIILSVNCDWSGLTLNKFYNLFCSA